MANKAPSELLTHSSASQRFNSISFNGLGGGRYDIWHYPPSSYNAHRWAIDPDVSSSAF